ncbi:MAG: hypothetical protein JXM68_08220 [Sedimentisphaerales bacterium]|nr:hypothetical protein [Sedimentisphaerales bacterium]
MKFPSKEQDVIKLANEMVAGYKAYATDFPSVTVTTLEDTLEAYNVALAALNAAKTTYELALQAKNLELESLRHVMKDDIKLSEADTSAEPEKLVEIGWGPRPTPVNPQIPGQVLNLRASYQQEGIVTLEWNKPRSGGAIRNYVLYRTTNNPSGGMNPWSMVDFFYDTLAELTDQPTGTKLYYMVRGSNIWGMSQTESNIVPVVL